MFSEQQKVPVHKFSIFFCIYCKVMIMVISHNLIIAFSTAL